MKTKRPNWIKVKAPNSKEFEDVKSLIQELKLNTVCQEAACPNIGECWQKRHATVMILGRVCTRACAFCNVATGQPDLIDQNEPERIAEAVKKLNLQHVVITSVDRDDLQDGGANHFANCIKQLRKSSPYTTIEILTPDFLKKEGAIEIIADSKPDVFSHNIETVPSLYKKIRPGARYFHSLNLLYKVKKIDKKIFTKSSIMVGLGENNAEIVQVMDDLRAADVDFITIGQYLQPTKNHIQINRYVSSEEFKYFKRLALAKGFLMVASSPLTRSSYHAGDDFKIMKQRIYNNLSLV